MVDPVEQDLNKHLNQIEADESFDERASQRADEWLTSPYEVAEYLENLEINIGIQTYDKAENRVVRTGGDKLDDELVEAFCAKEKERFFNLLASKLFTEMKAEIIRGDYLED